MKNKKIKINVKRSIHRNLKITHEVKEESSIWTAEIEGYNTADSGIEIK